MIYGKNKEEGQAAAQERSISESLSANNEPDTPCGAQGPTSERPSCI